MPFEIERKFLYSLTKEQVKELSTFSLKVHSIYLNHNPKHSVRVVKDMFNNGTEISFGTVKKSTDDPSVRVEIEHEIHLELFEAISTLGFPYVIKERFMVKLNGYTWEIDFFDEHPFVIAELEFKSKEESDNFKELPSWIVREVTDDPFYLNCNLSKTPNGTFK